MFVTSHDEPRLFSIIIPTYNRGEFIAKTIDSILGQTFSAIQLIIVDDGSTDNTFSVVNAYADSRICYFKISNRERGASRNYGMQKAEGKYINYFDSDDLFLPCLDELSKFIEKYSNPDVIYGAIEHINQQGKVLFVQKLPFKSFTKNLLHNNFMACGAVFLKREIAAQFLFHEDRRLSSSEDWELWLRIHARYSFTYFPHAIFQQVHHTYRSLNLINPEKIEVRDTYFASLVLQNENLRRFYGDSALRLFAADRYTFISLAWSVTYFMKSFYYWRKAIYTSGVVVYRKRFWAILNKLLMLRKVKF